MKILDLYAGIGGNRKLWKGHDITAVEINPDIAAIYSTFYPSDTIIIDDAHGYLLNHYSEYDFIWSSPPCPSHSDIRRMGTVKGLYPAVYPDIKLWEEITLLKHFAKKQKWVVENVVPYYDPIIEPSFKLDRHLFWSNFYAPPKIFNHREFAHKDINGNRKVFGYDISAFKIKDKRRLLRNMVNPEVGQYILNCASGSMRDETQLNIFERYLVGGDHS